MLKRKNLVFLMIISVFFVGCAGAIKNGIAEKNRASLMKIDVGMTKKEVIEIFGESNSSSFSNPFKREVKTLSNGQVQEALFFITSVIPDDKDTDDEMTPVIFVDKKVIGWGWSFYQKDSTEINIRYKQSNNLYYKLSQ